MLYLITYDLNKPGKNYEGLYEEIKKVGHWWHHLDSTWLVRTSMSADQIYESIQHALDESDRILIVKLARDYSGWLTKEAWEWINNSNF